MGNGVSSSTLVSLAILKTNYDELGKSYIHNFLPFLADCLNECSHSVASAPEIQECLEKTFGFRLPQGVIQTLLKRAAREGLVNVQDGVYVIDEAMASHFDLSAKRQDAIRKYEALVEKFQEFALSKHGVELQRETGDDLLLDFIEIHSLPILASVVRGDPIRVTPKDQDRNEFLVSSFILHLYESDPAGFTHLETTVKGSMLAASVFLQLGKPEQGFKKLELYLDTPFLIKALGFEGDSSKEAALELLRLAKNLGARLACFSHTLGELEGVLEACANSLSHPRKRRDHVRNVEEYCLEQRIGASDLQLMIARLRILLNNIDIRIADTPDYSKHTSVDEVKFESVLAEEVQYGRRPQLIHDLDSLTAIHRLRGGKSLKDLEFSSALFVTPNSGVVRSALVFFREELSGESAPHAILDHELMTLVWLKNPTAAPELPRKQIVADCYAALRPSETLWKKYLDELERLRDSESIGEDDYYVLRFSLDARRALMDATLGEPGGFSAGTIHEVLERARRNATADLEHELAAERDRTQSEKNARESESVLHAEERRSLTAQLAKREAKIEEEGDRIAQWVCFAVLCVIGLLFLGAFIGAFASSSSTSRIVGVAITSCGIAIWVLSAFGLWFGGSIRSWLEEFIRPRVRERAINFLRLRFLGSDDTQTGED